VDYSLEEIEEAQTPLKRVVCVQAIIPKRQFFENNKEFLPKEAACSMTQK
jgi:hypothetical protein